MSRQEISLTRYPTNQIRFYNGTRIQVDPEKTVYLTRDASGIAEAFAGQFQTLGIRAQLIDGAGDAPDLPDAAGIVAIPDAFELAGDDSARSFLFYTFDLMRKNAGYLAQSAGEKGGFFAALSFSGGGFGFDALPLTISPVYGGLAGLVIGSAAAGIPVVCDGLIATAGALIACEMAPAAKAYLFASHRSVEVGHRFMHEHLGVEPLLDLQFRGRPPPLHIFQQLFLPQQHPAEMFRSVELLQ